MTMNNETQAEVWRPAKAHTKDGLVELEGYEVSNTGRMRSYRRRGRGPEFHDTPYELKQTIHKADGYRMVGFRCNGKYYRPGVHNVVAATFLGPRPEGCWVAHNDGNPANNNVTNLRWATPKENSHDRFKHGTIGKLTEAEAGVIKKRLATGQRVVDIAKDYPQIRPISLYNLKYGTAWMHVLPELNELLPIKEKR